MALRLLRSALTEEDDETAGRVSVKLQPGWRDKAAGPPHRPRRRFPLLRVQMIRSGVVILPACGTTG